MSILVTGAAGFIGSNFLRILLANTDEKIIAYDALTYAGNLENIANLSKDQITFVHADICDKKVLIQTFEKFKVKKIIHFAAESHVDRSILSSEPFVQTNIVGTQRLLDASKKHGIERFIHISTDEVYGSLGLTDPAFVETSPIEPNSPYSASKAGSDLLVRSYIETFNFPAIITRCSNNYGPYQFPEKLIPLMIHNAHNNLPLPVYGNGKNIRDWIHVDDHSRAILSVFNNGTLGEVYNIGGESELTNIDIVQKIVNYCGANPALIQFVKDRPGHDFRYAIDIQKIKSQLGWQPKETFDEGLVKTIQWYKENHEWLNRIISGAYKDYYKEQYL